MVLPRPDQSEVVPLPRAAVMRDPLVVRVRAIAIIEGAKGALILLAGLGLPGPLTDPDRSRRGPRIPA